MAKNNYQNLFNEYSKYIERKAKNMEEVDTKRKEIGEELLAIQRDLANNATIMSAEDYREKGERIKALVKDADFYDKRKAELEKATGVTGEEYQEWEKASTDEVLRVKAEYDAVLYDKLEDLVATCEKYNTQIIKLSALRINFEKALGKRGGIGGVDMPDYVRALNRYLLVWFNRFARKVGKSEKITKCFNAEEYKTAVSTIALSGARVGCSATGNTRIPSEEQAIYIEMRVGEQ